MSEEVTDVRRAARYRLLQPVEGSFSGVDGTLVDLAVTGAQIRHGQPLRIGTRARLTYRYDDTAVAVQAQVVWSHVRQAEKGLVYTTGLHLASDTSHASALHTMIRAEIAIRDQESMERKRERERERQLRLQSGPKMQLPPATN